MKKLLIIVWLGCQWEIGLGGVGNGKEPLQIFVDTARFWDESLRSYIEIYQGVPRSALAYKKEGALYIARFRLETRIFKGDTVIHQETVTETDTVTHLQRLLPGQQFVFVLTLPMPEHQFQLVSTLEDLNTGKIARHSARFDGGVLRSRRFFLSDIQLATQITPAKEPALPFDKHGLRIMPNPAAIYGDGLENLSLYIEVYNWQSADETSASYRLDYIIENEAGKVLLRLPGKDRKSTARIAGISSSFDISGLPAGRYRLRVVAINSNPDIKAEAVKPFMIFRKEETFRRLAAQEANVYSQFDDNDLKHYFAQIAYIASEEEKQIFSQLSTEGKRRFLVQFWRRRDPTPNTPQNEFKHEYIRRLLMAKVQFSVGRTEGWQTDRGRILLTYGPPDFIDREPANSDKNAYEIWRYETLQGGAIFVFVDYNQNGLFPLVHSTYREEISNPDWERFLYK